MSNFIYSAMSGKNDPMFGKFEHPIKALIENESNICEKRKTILDTLSTWRSPTDTPRRSWASLISLRS